MNIARLLRITGKMTTQWYWVCMFAVRRSEATSRRRDSVCKWMYPKRHDTLCGFELPQVTARRIRSSRCTTRVTMHLWSNLRQVTKWYLYTVSQKNYATIHSF